MAVEHIVLVEGVSGKPLFNTSEEYELFRQEYGDAVKPQMDYWAECHARSELDARTRMVD
ncbi:MAG: hypothetical protein AABX11_07105 [Nanoarchaeota archaeon]